MLFAVGPAFAQEGGGRIAYVDMQRLIDSAPQVVAARAQERASEPPAAEGPKDGGQGAAPDAPSRSAVETSGPTGQD